MEDDSFYYYMTDNNFFIFLAWVAQRANNLMLFGSGVHSCPRNELAELDLIIE